MHFSEIPLFENISDSDCSQMISCFGSTTITLAAEQEIPIINEFRDALAIVLQGSVEISRIDFNGRKSILEIIEKNEMFGRLYSFSPEEHDSIIAKCLKPAEIFFIPNEKIERQCENACLCHTKLISNLLELMSQKTHTLSARVGVLSQRTIREKLISYFYQLAAVIGSDDFQLPYSMTTLADYLCVDRSAMTRELRNMKNDGLIDVQRRRVRILH